MTADVVRAIAHSLGFDFVSLTPATPVASDRAALEAWGAQGKAAGMEWLIRDPAGRSEPESFLAGARSVVSLAVSYFQGPIPEAPAAPAGRVARYAWGRDYHAVIESRLDLFKEKLRETFGEGIVSRSAVDAAPLLERAFARRGGLGFVGKNTNLIRPGSGSFLFLADIVVNREFEASPAAPAGCGGCTACQTKCPTGALVVPYSLDARLCVAYHTIENRGAIPPALRPGLGHWVFGCDDCQDVCPFNARAKKNAWPEFESAEGPGPWLLLRDVLSQRTPAEFKARFAGTSLPRAKRAGLLRNACVVAANTGRAEELQKDLLDCLRADADPLVRGHAAWALGGVPTARSGLQAALVGETDLTAYEEIKTALERAA